METSHYEKIQDYARRFFVARKLTIELEDVTPKAIKLFQLKLVVKISEMTFYHHFEYAFSCPVLEDDFYNVAEIACKQWFHDYHNTKAFSTSNATFENLSKFAQQRLWQVYRGYDSFELYERDLYKELLQSELIEDITLLPLATEAYWYRVVRLSSQGHRLLHKLDSEKAKD